jgi:hypothetical protein
MTTRVCAYDRPGAPHLDQTFSRSDPVPQPTSPQNGVDDLVALLKVADVPALTSNIMIDNAPLVIQAIQMLVDAVGAGQTSLKG